MTINIYLAGPEVFLPNATEVANQKKALCRLYGFEGLFPLDNELDLTNLSPQQSGLLIASSNEAMIARADAIIANMTPFRGTSCDVGTAYEMGLARGMGKPVFAYSNDERLFLARNLAELPATRRLEEGHAVDADGMQLEDFGLIDNLMLDGAVSAPIVTQAPILPDQRFSELLGFERCLQQARAFFAR